MRGIVVPGGEGQYRIVLASVGIGACVAYLLAAPLARGAISIAGRFSYRRVSVLALLLSAAIVLALTGIEGFFVMAVAGGIGLLPILFGTRRLNCLGVILLPLACNMSGVGAAVAAGLGLLN